MLHWPQAVSVVAAALHVPVDYYFMEANMDFEENVFIRNAQLMENYRHAEDKFAREGWQTCQIFGQAQLIRQTAVGDHSADGVEKLLSQVAFAVNTPRTVCRSMTVCNRPGPVTFLTELGLSLVHEALSR